MTDFWGLDHTTTIPPDTSGDFYTQLRDGTSREIIYDHVSYPNARVPLNSGTAFPSNAFVGQTFVYQADRANGVYWMFIYLPDETIYPWKFVGGAPLASSVRTGGYEATASAVYVALATAGPSITAPLAGHYFVAFGSQQQPDTAGAIMYHSIDVGAAAASDPDSADFRNSTLAGSIGAEGTSVSKVMKPGVAAGSVFVSKYRVGAGTGNWRNRWMELFPLAVHV